MKMEGLRRVYGMAEPIRRGMELKIVRDTNFTPMMLGGPRRNGGNVHEDILVLGGRDSEIGWEDVFHGMSLLRCFLCISTLPRCMSVTRYMTNFLFSRR